MEIVRDAHNYNKDERNKLMLELRHSLGLDGSPSKDKVKEDIESRFLNPPNSFPDHWLPLYQQTWNRKTNLNELTKSSLSAPSSKLSFQRAGLNGNIIGHSEVQIPISARENAKTSTSMLRAPGDASTFVRGKSGNVPFAPGGLDVVIDKNDGNFENKRKQGIDGENTLDGHTVDLSKGGLRTIPPGFTRGLKLSESDDGSLDLIAGISTVPEPSTSKHSAVSTSSTHIQSTNPEYADASIDELLPDSKPLVNTSTLSRRKAQIAKRDWAHVVDANKGLPNFDELVPDMAKKYPFKLDNFQQNAVYHLEMGDSVFVAAHTSAGKTVVAEYAVALASKHMTRTIYTSPIKALSNQKYRDFKMTFDPSQVGILTGDVQINPEGSCLIMTTEILRSMLYKGADLIRDVEFVVFDEVHYVNDAERGVVWEEVIIMLPEHINIILLSATVPNAKEFADWVGRTKRKNIYVISTPKRPVPLEHHLFAGKELHKIVDSSSRFLSNGHRDATDALRRKQDKEREANGLPPVHKTGAPSRGGRGGGGSGRPPVNMGAVGAKRAINSYSKTMGSNRGGGNAASGGNQNHHLVQYLKKKDLLPVVIFTFSKRKCEEHASGLGGMDLLTAAEKSEVHITIERSLSRLKGSDKQLPQITRMRDLLGRGLAVHHGGLLPIVKEIVELLFGKGVVKVLFATETFAMGVNMPARSVAFSGIRKHDGKSFRDLLPGEYTQMSGRAGRRGLDATGVVIIMTNDNIPETTTLQQMILGTPGKLHSQFRLTFNLILNLLRVETLKVEDMIKRSFSENASQKLLPDQQKQVEETEQRLSLLQTLDKETSVPNLNDFYNINTRLIDLNNYIVNYAISHPQGSKMFNGGRVILVRDSHFKGNLAILLRPPKFLPAGASKYLKYYWVVGLTDEDTKFGKNDIKEDEVVPRWPAPVENKENLVYDLISIPTDSISIVTKFVFKDLDINAIVNHHRKSVLQSCGDYLETLLTSFENNKVLDERSLEIDWSKIRGVEFHEALKERENLIDRLKELIPIASLEEFDSQYGQLHVKAGLKNQIDYLKASISDQNLELLPDYENRIGALKELQYIDANATVQIKGRVACEINSAHELILTELILENTFAAYEPEEVVALLSCFLFQEKSEVEPIIPPKLEEGRDVIYSIADRVQRVLEKHKIESEDFESILKFGLVEVVYEWAKGMPFEQITQLTDVPEGTIVRVITRLDQTCLEVRDAARVIGDAALFQKMEACQMMIKRDIIFAASLYV